jgi:hypothetical protein
VPRGTDHSPNLYCATFARAAVDGIFTDHPDSTRLANLARYGRQSWMSSVSMNGQFRHSEHLGCR